MTNQKTLIVIPARWDSTRFPGKMLAPIQPFPDPPQRPLIKWTWAAAKHAVDLGVADRVIVATDSPVLYEAVRDFGGEAVMTHASCRNGTERCAQAVSRLEAEERYFPHTIVNWQGDAPGLPTRWVQDTIKTFDADDEAHAATAVSFHVPDPGQVTAVMDRQHRALYFSRTPIPWTKRPATPRWVHHGLYVYDRRALAQYAATTPTPLEGAEDLEQLRWVERGFTMSLALVTCKSRPAPEVNWPGDVARFENWIREQTAPNEEPA